MNYSKMLVEFIFGLFLLKSFWVLKTLLKLEKYVTSYCTYRAKLIKPIVLDESINQNDVQAVQNFLIPKLRKLREDLQMASPKYVMNHTLKIPSVFVTFFFGLFCSDGSDFINMDMISKMEKELKKANA